MEQIQKIFKQIFSTKQRKAIGVAAVVLLIMMIVPPLRQILYLLITFAVIAGVCIAGYKWYKWFIKRTVDSFHDSLPKTAQKYPAVWQHFSVLAKSIPTPLPELMTERCVWRSLPNELRQTEPTLNLAPDLVLKALSATSNAHFNTANMKSIRDAGTLEDSAVRYIMLSSLVTMSDKLGIGGGKEYQKDLEYLNKFEVIAEQGSKRLYFYNSTATYTDMSFIKRQLQNICNAMNVDYDSASAGTYEPGRSSYWGMGSWGMVGLGAALSIGSRMNAAGKKTAFEQASVYIAYNNIADYFSSQYFPEEYAAWKAEQSPGRVKLTGSHTNLPTAGDDPAFDRLMEEADALTRETDEVLRDADVSKIKV